MIKVLLPNGKIILFKTKLELDAYQEFQPECIKENCKIRNLDSPIPVNSKYFAGPLKRLGWGN